MKNILIFTYGNSLRYWNEQGIISREIAIYNNLVKKKVHYSFLTIGSKDDFKFSDMIPNIKIIPANEYFNLKIPMLLQIKNVLKILFIPIKLRNVFRDVDLIKTNQMQGALIPVIVKLLFNKKYILRGGNEMLNSYISFHLNKTGLIDYLKYIYGYIRRYLYEFFSYKLADGIILTNKEHIEFIISKFNLKKKFLKGRIKHFYNYIDTELFNPQNLPKKDRSLVFIGRLEKIKNIDSLLEAMKKLDGFKLDIVGGGNLKQKYLNYAKENRIDVTFLGKIKNEEIPFLLNKYQIFILPSIVEGNPKALLEAMSCGIACIGTDIPGINSIINHRENGYLCDKDPNSIAEAVKEVYRNKKLRTNMEKNARKFII